MLVGLPGAGKSTTGRRLAKILGVAFADSDELIEAATGLAVRELLLRAGEAEFRRAEEAAITAALADFDGVLALGGGALTSVVTRQALAGSGVVVVVLTAPLEILAARIGDARTRPLLADDPPGRLATLAREREPVYREVATFTVRSGNRTPGQLASQIAARLQAVRAQRAQGEGS